VRNRSWLLGLGIGLLAAGASAQAAGGDGLPVGGVDVGAEGVSTPGGEARYFALPAARGSVIARVERSSGRLLASRTVRERLSVPAVAADGSASGLSADGRTLVLIAPRRAFPAARTRFAVLDARTLRRRRSVALRGDFSIDAISPDGQRLFLIEYLSRRDYNRYQVRAYDTVNGRLLPKPVVDPREAGEAMRGYPISRASSADGRWAYTLYDGQSEHPFVHALDTVRATAVCVDLDALAGRRDLFALRLRVSADGRRVLVAAGSAPAVAIDTRTFRASLPSAGSAPPAGGAGRGPLWAAGGALATLAAVLGVSLARSRRRRERAPGGQPAPSGA